MHDLLFIPIIWIAVSQLDGHKNSRLKAPDLLPLREDFKEPRREGMELHGSDAGDTFSLRQESQHVRCMITWYALYAPTALRHLIFGGWTCILNLFTDFFKPQFRNASIKKSLSECIEIHVLFLEHGKVGILEFRGM